MNFMFALPEWLWISLSLLTFVVAIRAVFSAVKFILKIVLIALFAFAAYVAFQRVQQDPALLNRLHTWVHTFSVDSVGKALSPSSHR